MQIQVIHYTSYISIWVVWQACKGHRVRKRPSAYTVVIDKSTCGDKPWKTHNMRGPQCGRPTMREAYNAGGRTRVNMGFPGQIRHKRALESQGEGDKWQNTWGRTIKGHYPITFECRGQTSGRCRSNLLGHFSDWGSSFPPISSGLTWAIDIGLLQIKDKQTSLAPLTRCSHLNDSLASFRPHSLYYVLWTAFGSDIQQSTFVLVRNKISLQSHDSRSI